MISLFFNTLLFILSIGFGYYSICYLGGHYALAGMFLSGLLFGLFLMKLRLNVKNSKINLYKRELEKEAISSTESDAKVKVLESKIEVLEKALQNALQK